MAGDKQLRIMRAMVLALYDYSTPQDLATVLCAPELRLEAPDGIQAAAAWNRLAEAGLIVLLPGFDNQVGKLSDNLRQKIANANGALPMIPELYGARALK